MDVNDEKSTFQDGKEFVVVISLQLINMIIDFAIYESLLLCNYVQFQNCHGLSSQL